MDWDGFGAQARSFLHRARSTHRDCCASLSSPRPNALIGVSSSSTIPGQQCPLREVCNKRARAGPTTQLPYKGSTSSEQRCDRGAQAWMVERLEFSGGDCLVVRREASRLARVSASARRALRIWRTREIAAIASPPQILSTSICLSYSALLQQFYSTISPTASSLAPRLLEQTAGPGTCRVAGIKVSNLGAVGPLADHRKGPSAAPATRPLQFNDTRSIVAGCRAAAPAVNVTRWSNGFLLKHSNLLLFPPVCCECPPALRSEGRWLQLRLGRCQRSGAVRVPLASDADVIAKHFNLIDDETSTRTVMTCSSPISAGA
ncbi:hypothetical protein HDK90DRAFT_48892 [Phyllosticta capitalensis]|uniref:Uncharacterized protein n=1 Tax=Phyllosticta capitalensis TaxID=121624 RepID=A0ABR1YDU6_9PEZI